MRFSFLKFLAFLGVFFGFCEISLAKNFADEFVKKAREKSLADDEYWRLLLHYDGLKSRISDSVFFLAKDGYKNPKAELEADLRGFFDEKLSEDHAICKFPARLRWLKEKLAISDEILPKPKCQGFKTYLEKTAADEISVVFASENTNNLISMMGHIFLKISGKSVGRKVEHSLGYFADMRKTNSISFLVGSISYGASGIYVLEPYDQKVAEYNNKEKRSIWEYRLKFSQKQIDALWWHLWELKNVDVEYNFITHNCGSALLSLLYLSDKKLQEQYKIFDAPLDIIHALYLAGYIDEIAITPSDAYKFRMIEGNFSKKDRQIMHEFLKDWNFAKLDEIRDERRKANVIYGIETVLNYQFVNNDILVEKYDEIRVKLNDISKNLPQNNLVYEVKNPLQKTHSSRLSLGYQNGGGDRNAINFGFYPVYNDLFSDNSQYFNEIQLQLMNFEGAYYEKHDKLRLNNVDLLKIKNLIDYSSFVGGISGSFRLNFERERFDSISNKMFSNVDFGAGFGEKIGENVLFYGLANFGFSHFNSHNILYTNPEFGAIIKEGGFGKLNLKYVKYFASQDYKYREVFGVDQVIFLNQANLVFSAKRVNVGLEEDFSLFSVNYQLHF